MMDTYKKCTLLKPINIGYSNRTKQTKLPYSQYSVTTQTCDINRREQASKS